MSNKYFGSYVLWSDFKWIIFPNDYDLISNHHIRDFAQLWNYLLNSHSSQNNCFPASSLLPQTVHPHSLQLRFGSFLHFLQSCSAASAGCSNSAARSGQPISVTKYLCLSLVQNSGEMMTSSKWGDIRLSEQNPTFGLGNPKSQIFPLIFNVLGIRIHSMISDNVCIQILVSTHLLMTTWEDKVSIDKVVFTNQALLFLFPA